LDPDPTASERHVTRKPSSSFAKPRSHTAARNVPDHTGVVRVAAIQMASGPNVSANLAEAERLIQIAVDSGAKLVALPENFAIMGVKETDKINVREEPGKGPIQKFLGAQAKKHGIWLIGGSVPLECGNARKVFNSCLVYDDKGKQVARYDKIHLFGLDLGNEHYKRTDHHRSRATKWLPSNRRSDASACRSATTCVSLSCIGRWATWTSSSCRRPSPPPPARPTSRP
jgi:hypothetical protein